MFTSIAEARAYTRTFNETLDWTEKSIELIIAMAASAYEGQIWEMYLDCDSWESYVKKHLHTNRIKLTINERRQVVMKLYYEYQMTYREVGATLGVGYRTVGDDIATLGKTAQSSASIDAADAAHHAARGGRGRPRGSRNKPASPVKTKPEKMTPVPSALRVAQWAHEAVTTDVDEVFDYAEQDTEFHDFIMTLIAQAKERWLL